MKRHLCALIIVSIMGASASAAEFYPITSVSSSTDASDLWPASNLIQGPGVGFDAAAPHDKTLGGADGNWVTDAPGGFPSDYIATAGMPVLTFDLGSDTALNEISTWGYAASNTNGVSEFSLSFATEAQGPGNGTVTAGPFMMAGDLAVGTNDDTSRQSFGFELVNARYVEMTVNDNFFVAPGDGSNDTVPGGDRAGMGEVAFEVVPEPSSGMLLLLGLLAFLRRRR